jgi:hypothetical protein
MSSLITSLTKELGKSVAGLGGETSKSKTCISGAVIWIWSAPHRPCVKGLGLSLSVLGGVGSGGKFWVTENMSLKEIVGPWSLFFSFSSVHEVSGLAVLCALCYGMLPCHRPESSRTRGSWAGTSEIMSQSEPKFIMLGVCWSDRKLISTLSFPALTAHL